MSEYGWQRCAYIFPEDHPQQYRQGRQCSKTRDAPGEMCFHHNPLRKKRGQQWKREKKAREPFEGVRPPTAAEALVAYFYGAVEALEEA